MIGGRYAAVGRARPGAGVLRWASDRHQIGKGTLDPAPPPRGKGAAMTLFGRTPTPCPICRVDLGPEGTRMDHFQSHVTPITAGKAAGGFTWRCACGPASMYWRSKGHAAAGLTIHMQHRHHIML